MVVEMVVVLGVVPQCPAARSIDLSGVRGTETIHTVVVAVVVVEVVVVLVVVGWGGRGGPVLVYSGGPLGFGADCQGGEQGGSPVLEHACRAWCVQACWWPHGLQAYGSINPAA